MIKKMTKISDMSKPQMEHILSIMDRSVNGQRDTPIRRRLMSQLAKINRDEKINVILEK